MLNVKISGYYRSGKENIDFATTVTMPECANNKVQANIQNRVVHRVFKDAEKPYSMAGKCWVDDVKKDNKEPSFVGKNIKELNWDEIQEVAIAYDLNAVPLFRTCSLREALMAVYKEFCNVVKHQNLGSDFDYAVAPDFTLGEKKVGKKKVEAEATTDEGQSTEE